MAENEVANYILSWYHKIDFYSLTRQTASQLSSFTEQSHSKIGSHDLIALKHLATIVTSQPLCH